jgi:hypothetical protein
MDIQSSNNSPLFPSDLMSVKQTAKVLGISVKTLRDYILYREIEFVKPYGKIGFRPEAIADLIKRSIVPATGKRCRKGKKKAKTAETTEKGEAASTSQGSLLESERSDSGKESQ